MYLQQKDSLAIIVRFWEWERNIERLSCSVWKDLFKGVRYFLYAYCIVTIFVELLCKTRPKIMSFSQQAFGSSQAVQRSVPFVSREEKPIL